MSTSHTLRIDDQPAVRATPRSEESVSLLRLYMLRAIYLLVVVGLGVVLWPGIVHPSHPWALDEGVVKCMLAAFSLLCLVGLCYPLQMIPLLLWELLWKSIWLLDVALPAWREGRFDEAIASNAAACALVVLVPLVLPWRYVVRNYLLRPGNRWCPSPSTVPESAP